MGVCFFWDDFFVCLFHKLGRVFGEEVVKGKEYLVFGRGRAYLEGDGMSEDDQN